jgi:hypothetical protein
MITLLTVKIALVVLVVLTESRAFAGVVIAETMVSSDPIGGSQVQTRIVYTQGDKRKVEARGIDVITDLDKDILYVVDKNQREYAEIPCGHWQCPGPAMTVRHLKLFTFMALRRCGLSQPFHARNTAGLS